MVLITTAALALYLGEKILAHIIHNEAWHKRLRHWFNPPKDSLHYFEKTIKIQ